jgi:hypothetical protein
MASGFPAVVAIAAADGPTITAAAATSCLPLTARFSFPPNAFAVGSALRIHASGRISNVVTTPGTARLDVRLGGTGGTTGTVVYDTGAMILNQVAKTTLPWRFSVWLTCRAVGSTGNFWGVGDFQSESIVGSALPSVSGSGGFIVPVGVTAVGANVDLTLANMFEMVFTQTVATGSFTVHQFILETLGVALS